MSPCAVAVGCDIGGTAIKCVRVANKEIESESRVATPASTADLVDAVVESIDQHLMPHSHSAVGVAFCGHLDAARRSVIRSTNLPFLEDFPLADAIEARFSGATVVLDTDTNAGAVAESVDDDPAHHTLYVALGTGVGAALTRGGEPVRVRHHTVGHIAALRLPGAHEQATVESELSSRGILERAARSGIHVATTAELYDLACRDDMAQEVWRRVGVRLGELLAQLSVLWSPQRIVIGGGTTGADEYFLQSAQQQLAVRLEAPPRLTTARHGTFANAVGAAFLASR